MENKLMDLSNFKENLTQKVKQEFVNLLPEDAVDNFVKDVVKKFEEEEMEKLAMDVLKEHAKKQLEDMLRSKSYGQWSSEENRKKVDPEIEKLLIKAAPKMFGNIMQEIAMNTFHNISNGY